MADRIRPIRKVPSLGRAAFAERIGVKKKTIENAHQRPTAEVIEGIGRVRPHFAYWLVTGMEDLEHGHISPATEQMRNDLGREEGRVA